MESAIYNMGSLTNTFSKAKLGEAAEKQALIDGARAGRDAEISNAMAALMEQRQAAGRAAMANTGGYYSGALGGGLAENLTYRGI